MEVNAEELDILCPLSPEEIHEVQAMQNAMQDLRHDMLTMMRDTVSKYDKQRLEHPDGHSYTFHDEDGDKCAVIALEIIEGELTAHLEYESMAIERNVKACFLDVFVLYEIMVQMIDE